MKRQQIVELVKEIIGTPSAPQPRGGKSPNGHGNPETKNDVAKANPEDDLVFAEYGPPFITDDNGKVRLNERSVATKCATLNMVSYDHTLKIYERFDQPSGLWAPIHEGEVRRLLADLLLKLGADYGHEQFVRLNKTSQLNSLCKMVQAYRLQVAAEDTIGLVHLANGVLDLRGNAPKLRPHDAKFQFRFSSGIHYNPKAKCPRFLNQLLRSALATEDIALLQKYCGSMLLGPNTCHGILLVGGTAGGGKSTLVTILEKVLGEDSVAHLRTKHLNGRFETSGFLNKRVLLGKDVPGDTLSEKGAQFLKALTGGDLLQAEIKYNAQKQPIRGDFHVVIVSNSKLRIALSGDEGAWGRRLLMVEFENARPVKPIPNFAEKLVAEEASGILNWLIDGAMACRKELERIGFLALTARQKQRVAALLHDSDSTRSFIEHCVREKSGGDVTSEELLLRYYAECEKHNWCAVSSHEFQTRVPDLLGLKFKVARRNDITREGHAVRGYKGIVLT
jgi:P4 family phage/plasmid primase-like protien